MWFLAVAIALKQIQDVMKIEMCLGNVTAVLEHIRYGLVGHRCVSTPASLPQDSAHEFSSAAVTSPHQKAYPTVYDRIHLSNIPDYIGGTLSSFLYTLPAIRTGDHAFLTSTCLRNPPRFKAEANFNNEYIAMSSSDDLRKTFQVHCEGPTLQLDEVDKMRHLLMPSPMALNDYYFWTRTPSPQTPDQRMTRERLETWLYRIFLKVNIPVQKKSIQDFVLIDLLSSQYDGLLPDSDPSPYCWLPSTLTELYPRGFAGGQVPDGRSCTPVRAS
jgi:hypothetical protein